MDDLSLEKIEISGSILASMIQRASSSPSDVDGLIFGQIHRIVSSNLSDDSPADSFSSSSSSDQIVATVTSFACSGKTVSFYDPLGRVNSRRVDSLRVDSPDRLIGWFSARRKTANRPSMRESAVTSSLSSQFHLPIEDSQNPKSTNMASSVFFLLTTPSTDQCIHTHEYRAYQFRSSKQRLEPRSVGVVNIGPAFRGHYGSFIPKSGFPPLVCELDSSAMVVDRDEGSLGAKKQAAKDQKEIDALAEGLQVGDLKRLVGAEAASFTGGIEDMYERMLAKIQSLASDVETSSAFVFQQEKHNRKLRNRVARIGR
ncbi:PREDICTED: BRISC complex subunit Abro1-like isoform X2 [Camelina sativa]|uniref:BRISC complex subunit Abro1-like isoform X1 n=1 Tax=Camelina sativa TaxID=90675 RepID=A0ABM0XIC8_CAMSA|nr:PREDICTED: BRISC complex subunit Abro1-like isoform X1 [Camelina sativa]XP_019096197.1 PREDICTED: BRISC complex subunit Abro1-like isoform X2 [Camelina sativa]